MLQWMLGAGNLLDSELDAWSRKFIGLLGAGNSLDSELDFDIMLFFCVHCLGFGCGWSAVGIGQTVVKEYPIDPSEEASIVDQIVVSYLAVGHVRFI